MMTMANELPNTAMNINELPYDILKLVIGEITGHQCYNFHEWKQQLLLLSVCSKWRAVGVPLVYEGAEISYGDPMAKPRSIDAQTSLPPEPIDLRPSTNIDLALATGNMQYIRRLHIKVHYQTNPFPGLYTLLAYLHNISCHWHRVHTLELTVRGNHMLARFEHQSTLVYFEELQQTVRALAKLVPHLHELRFGGSSPSPVAHAVYGGLVGVHARKVAKLRSCHPVFEYGSAVFNNLTHLDIRFAGDAEYQMPPVMAHTLVSLTLSNIPLDYAWLSFIGGDPRTDINFTRLKALMLTYRDTHIHEQVTHKNHNMGKIYNQQTNNNTQTACTRRLLRFPVIEYMHVMAPGSQYPVLECSEFPRRMKTLHLDGSIELLNVLDETILPRIGVLSLNIIFDSSNNVSKALDAINTICCRAAQTAMVRLEVFNQDDIQFSQTPMFCTFVTEVDIRAPISAAHVLNIINLMPRLSKLELAGIIFGSNEIIGNGGNGGSVGSEVCWEIPAHPRISVLSIIQCTPDTSKDKCVAFVQMLILRLPLLSVLNARQLPCTPIEKFIGQMAHAYPHLSNIELNFK